MCQKMIEIGWLGAAPQMGETQLFSIYLIGLGDTDDTTMYRDTEFPRYWYRQDDDTFWYRDTMNIAVFSLSRPADKLWYLLCEYFSLAFI
jgi:hypothetical protein